MHNGQIITVSSALGHVMLMKCPREYGSAGWDARVRARKCVCVGWGVKRYHASREELAGETNVDGRLLLVTREHPDLDAGLGQLEDGLGHAVLQLVLDRCSTKQEKILFDLLCHIVHLLCAVNERRLGLLKLLVPLRVPSVGCVGNKNRS